MYPHVEQFETKALHFAERAGEARPIRGKKTAARRPAGRSRALGSYATSLRLSESASARSFFKLWFSI
jgi:hypothetical protein